MRRTIAVLIVLCGLLAYAPPVAAQGVAPPAAGVPGYPPAYPTVPPQPAPAAPPAYPTPQAQPAPQPGPAPAPQPAAAPQAAPAAPQPDQGIPAPLRLAIENVSCGEAAAALQRANADAAAKGRGQVMGPDVLRACGEALEVMKAALMLKQYGAAYEAIYNFHAKAGLVPALDAGALAKRSAQFAQEFTQTVKEAQQGKVPTDKLAKRAVLGALPVSYWFAPEFREKMPPERARLVDEVAKAETWPKFEQTVDQLHWLGTYLREPGFEQPKASLAALIAGAKKGAFYDKADDWKKIEAGPSPALQAIARRARGLAALDLATKADAKVKVRDWTAAAALLKQATALAPDDPKLGAKRQIIYGKVAAERETLMNQLKGAKKPKDAQGAWKKIDALDAATDGPGTQLKPEMKLKIGAALDAAAAGKQAEVIAALPGLNPGQVDYAVETVALLKGWTRAPILARADGERRVKDYAGAEKTLSGAAALFPGDKEIADLLAAVRAEAAANRFERFETPFAQGNVATGYVLLKSDTALAPADRQSLLAKHAAEVQALKGALVVRGRLQAADPLPKKVAAAAAWPGSWWALQLDGDARPGGLNTVGVALRLAAPPDYQPKLLRTEKAVAKTQGPPQQVPNPDRVKCDNAYRERAAKLAAMEQQAKQPAPQGKCAPAQSGEGWAGFGGETVAPCPPAPAAVDPQAIAAERQALAMLGQQCAAYPPYVTTSAVEQTYDIEHLAVTPAAALEVVFTDAARQGAEIGKETLSESLKYEDRQVRPQPQLGVPGKPPQFPTPDAMEGQLAAALAPKLKAAFEKNARNYWQQIEADAKAAAGAQRCELFARLLVLEEVMNVALPNRAGWDVEAKKCAGAPAKPGK